MQLINTLDKPFSIRDFVTFDRNGRAYCPNCEQNKGRRPSQKSLAVLESGAYKCHAGCTPEEIRASLGVPKNGSLSTSLDVRSPIRGTRTQTGLRVKATHLEGHFPSKVKVSDEEMAQLNLVRRRICPQWNYCLMARTPLFPSKV